MTTETGVDEVRRRPRSKAMLIVLGLAIVAIIAVVAAAVSRDAEAIACQPDAPMTTTSRTDKRPNVVVIMTDDQTLADLQFMPKTKELLGTQGTTFQNSFATYPLCCPSRATAVTGQYAHNHGVLNNVPARANHPEDYAGGYDKLDSTNTLPVWLQKAGYTTAHVGKYLNGYGETSKAVVPPGYTDWYGLIDPSVLQFYDYSVLDNGVETHCGSTDADYQTDVISRRAANDIKKFAQDSKPFYLTVWPLAPHSATDKNTAVPNRAAVNPISPLPRAADIGKHKDLTFPRGKSFMEADVSDKPPAQQSAKAKIAEGLEKMGISLDELDKLIDDTYRARADALIAVDDLVENVVNTLKATGQLDNTVVMFTSDNGWLLGEHAIPFAKVVLYEEAVKVPLLVRGPGFPAGLSVTQIVGNIDVAPTVAAIAGATPGLAVDGIDIRPIAADKATGRNRAILLEEYSFKPLYKAVRVPGFMYAEYEDGNVEFYDLTKDPDELVSKAKDPAYEKTRARLKVALQQLEACKATACQVEVPQAELRG
jgi:N-acetylglucosamine-6-sulfatase